MTIREFIEEARKESSEKIMIIHHGEYMERHSVKNGIEKTTRQLLNRDIVKKREVCNNTVHLYIYPDARRHELHTI